MRQRACHGFHVQGETCVKNTQQKTGNAEMDVSLPVHSFIRPNLDHTYAYPISGPLDCVNDADRLGTHY